MLHACIQRFDVTGNLEKLCKILGTKHYPSNTPIAHVCSQKQQLAMHHDERIPRAHSKTAETLGIHACIRCIYDSISCMV